MKAQDWKRRRKEAPPPPSQEEPRWFWGEKALEATAEYLSGFPGPLLLVGEAKLLRAWRRKISSALIEAGLDLMPSSFPESSECWRGAMEGILGEARAKGAKVLIALGGGKCLDSAKWAAEEAAIPLITLPSSSATCAAATRVLVEHDEAGEVLRLRSLKRSPVACIVDFEILESEPERLRRAGMADTLAKALEWKALEEPEGPGAQEAEEGSQIVLNPQASLESLWEANLRLSSRASNWGDAPAAAAHSFCAGISCLPQSRAWLHGEWVALGLLFQAKLLGEDSSALETWLERQGLPRRLPFPLRPEEELRVLARMRREDESLWLLKDRIALKEEQLLDAFHALRS